jgi:hypothetical protein
MSRGGPYQLEDFNRLGQTLDRDRPQSVDADCPLDQP